MELKKCLRCGYGWQSRIEGEPKRCPKCKSAYWNVPRTRKSREEIESSKE